MLLSDVTAYKNYNSNPDPFITRTDTGNKQEPNNLIMKSVENLSGAHSASNPMGTRGRGAVALS
jgi:hypothetical protein